MKLAVKIAGGLLGLLVLILGGLAIYIFASAAKPSRPVGLQQIAVADPGHRPIPVTIWYPTSARPRFVLLGLTGQRVASDAPIFGNKLPLVVVSHGTGGSSISHADTALALAENGYVVAALTHPGDKLQDDSDVGKPQWLPNRTRHVRRVVDAMLGNWNGSRHVDPTRIGLFGFSAGATTALMAIGGVPDLRRIASQCAARPEFVCKLTSPQSYRNAAALKSQSDERIDAAVIAAPGLGFAFEPDGLSNVRAKVQLWSGADDRTVPFATNAGAVQRSLPGPVEAHVVPKASHYSFLAPCGFIGPPEFCRDQKEFERKKFHRGFNRSIVRFFDASLGGTSAAPR